MERPVSLLYLATVPAPLRNFYTPYASHFRALGWRVSAAASGAASVAALRESFDDVYDVPLSRSVRDVRSNMAAALAIRDLLGNGFDLVHVHTPIAAFVSRACCRLLPAARRPRVAYSAHGFHFHHDGAPVANFLYLTAEQVAGRWTDRLVVINREDWAAARSAGIVPRRRLLRMPGVGIDTSVYSRAAVTPDMEVRARHDLGVGLETPVFLVVGELHPNKRQVDAIAALAAMRHREAHLVLLGEGRERANLEAVRDRLDLGDRVHLPGFVEDVRPFIAMSAAVVLPSAREGLSRSLMESMSLETPVIASTARGNEELVAGDAGIVYSTGDVLALADAMDTLLENPLLAEAFGRAGRARMTAGYELETVIRQHELMYRSMLEDRART